MDEASVSSPQASGLETSELLMTERGYRNLNTSVLRQISKALEHDPAADIESVLSKVYTPYARLRQEVGTRQAKRRSATDKDEEGDLPPAKRLPPSFPNALLSFASALQSQRTAPEPHLLGPLASPITFQCSLPFTIVFPLSPAVCDLLGTTDGGSSDLSSLNLRRVFSGVRIWESVSRAVIRVGENVIVKVVQHLDHDEHGVLQFLEQHIPNIPAPRALGLFTIATTSFMFMTLIPGATLETRWPSLSAEAKTHMRRVLDKNYRALREMVLPPSTPFGCPIGRRVCKDIRRDERVSAGPLYSEAEFNDFLLESPSCRAAPGHKNWLRSMLRVDHRTVFTHADLHPRNVLVVDRPDGGVELSGIIDWEASGFYPEYWEELKAMNTRSIKDTSDWWDHLPPSILGYDHDIVLDRLIESTVLH